jgi:hypothetical protein
MSTFTGKSKSSQSAFQKQNKDSSTWTNTKHSDIQGFGFDIQTFDNPNAGFDQTGNVLVTIWTVSNKEIG